MSGIPAGAGSLLGKRLGKYEILALLALGGTAEIYLARIGGAAGFEKYVVVKCLHDHLADDQEFVKMFLDEARLAAHLDHSNIVQTMELGEHENRYYMVMEFLGGLSLAMVVRRAGERLPGGRVPVPLVLNMMAQACAGLHYAHERAVNGKVLNIVHRDISPQNLVVSFEGVVKVVDFGIAKAEQRQTATRAGTIKGKFAYMSPEQCVANNVDRRTDIFALGVIAHELLTGRRLFKRNSPYETYQAVIECQVEPPSKMNVELDPAIDAIIMKSVAKDKDQRYPTAEAFGDALLGYLHHRGKGSGPGDVSRFFDANFSQEIEEHGARMRELISGQEEFASVDTGVNWGGDDDEAKRNETVDLGAKAGTESLSLDTGDLIRPSAASLSDVIGGMASNNDGHANDDDDDDEDRGESTRIESNPLENVAQMNSAAAHQPARQPVSSTVKPAAKPTGKTPAPSVVIPSVVPKTGPSASKGRPALGNSPAATAPTAVQAAQQPPPVRSSTARAPVAMPPSGPLPLPAPPTGPVQMVNAAAATAPEPAIRPSAQRFPAANLPTMIAEEIAAPELARTELGGQVVDPSHGAQPYNNGMQHGGPQQQPMQQPMQQQPMQQQPMGYPVMDPLMSEQLARGADLFPSAPVHHGRPQHAGDSGARPLPGSGPQHAQSGPQHAQSGPQHAQSGPQHAANFMSPVGAQYPQQVDWAEAAAMPARALPTWMMIMLFILAIGVALGLTIVVAKLIR